MRVRGGIPVKVALHVDQLWFDAPGGIGTYVRELWSRFPSDVVAFSARWRRRPPTAPLTQDGRFPAIELPLPIRLLYPAWDYLRLPPLPRMLADAHVVHATNHVAVPPVRPGQKLVVTVHDLAFRRFPDLIPTPWRRLYERSLRVANTEAERILVPSVSVRDEVASAGADPARIEVIPLASSVRAPGLDAVDAVRDGVRDRGITPPYVLAVGTIEPRKNLPRLVRAYRRLAAEGIPHRLVLVGPDGWGVQELRRELAVGGPGRVVRTSNLTEDELAVAYADADAAAYISVYEGFGLPVVEAMSMGAPVVASDASSIPEVAGDAALLVDPTDEGEIADALRRVLTDRPLADDLGRRGRERAAAYSWDRTVAATLEIYRSLAGS
jgi:glycosyltransferase involved in cell wall biosynthesis